MEKSKRVAVVPVNMGWSDVGCWDALHELEDRDDSGNLVDGDIIALETSNCLLKSNGVRIATLGVHDLVIVATGETVLVIPRPSTGRAQAGGCGRSGRRRPGSSSVPCRSRLMAPGEDAS